VLHPDGDSEPAPEALAESRRPTADGSFEPM
jgi:hypothetical protein